MTIFAMPFAFLLLILPFLVFRFLPSIKGLHGDALKVPFLKDLKNVAIKSGAIWASSSDEKKFKHSRFFWMLYIIWFFLIFAAARPQYVGEPQRIENLSRDIVLVLDLSTSMLQQDFAQNGRRLSRLSAVKKTVADFAQNRVDDRLALILFGTRAYMQVPLTYDTSAIVDTLQMMQAGMAGDSTSIGDALALALKSLQNDENKKNKVIILLTDGESNDGSIALSSAIKMAENDNVRIYTIGVGAKNSLIGSLFGLAQNMDDVGLKKIAQVADGQYFRAESASDLVRVYAMIDKLETSENRDAFVRKVVELYYIPLLVAILVSFALALGYRRVL